MIVVGIFLEVLAAALGTTSKQLIAYSEHVNQRWIFHLGAGINIFVGPVIDASAYAFAPQVVIAPFACLDVIFNALTAPYTLKFQQERMTRVHVIGTGLVSLGACFTAVFGSVSDDVLTVYELEAQLMKPASMAYLAVEFCLIVGMNLCLKARLVSATVRGISLGVIAGILMGNVFCMKGLIGIVRTSITNSDADAWLRPTPYILLAGAAGGAVLGHVFMRKGLGEYKGIFMVTIFEGAHITAACLSGCVVMEEMAHAPWWQYVLYWMSVSMIVGGMVLMNTTSADSKLARSFHIAQSFAEDEAKSTELAKAGSGQGPYTEEPLLEGTRHRGAPQSRLANQSPRHDDEKSCKELELKTLEVVRHEASGDLEANLRKGDTDVQAIKAEKAKWAHHGG